MLILEAFTDIISTSLQILNDVSPWLIISFAVAGLMHHILKPEKFQRMLGNRKLSSIIKATLSGVLLPVCSCGVIPLGLGMYYSGAYLGPTLAFMVATPIINPAAVLLAYGLLGPQIATIYLISGFTVPIVIGVLGNMFSGSEIHAPGMDQPLEALELEADEDISLRQKLLSGLHWGFMDLGVMVSKYIVPGILLAGAIIAVAPQSLIQQYLGNPGMISILGIAVIGSVMYVCAVGHIPFVAALVASGAAPGVAVTFLMTGAATNLPELISIYKMIGKRTVAIYTLTVLTTSMLIGFLTNLMLLPDFVPFFNFDKTSHAVGIANMLIFSAPPLLKYLSSVLVFVLFTYAFLPRMKKYFAKAEAL